MGVKLGWLATLADEISTAKRQVSADELLAEFQDFIRRCSDAVLRESYPHPDEIDRFLEAETPYASTIDLILSFLGHRYPEVRGASIDSMQRRIREQAKVDAKHSELTNTLREEAFRRQAGKYSYWKETAKRLDEKYVGFYCLVRLTSDGKPQAEFFAVGTIRYTPILMLPFYWQCEGETRVGELLSNTYRLSGQCVVATARSVIEPVSVNLLRTHPTKDMPDENPLVLGGLVCGWMTRSEHSLTWSRVALIKLDDSRPDSVSDFDRLCKYPDFLERKRKLLEFVKDRAMEEEDGYFGQPGFVLHPEQAAAAFKGSQ